MLNVKAFGLAGGVLWGAMVFLCTWLNIFFGYGPMWMSLLADFYPGFHVSFIGSFIGLIYGFIDGFIALFVIGWLYNKFS